MAVAPHGKIPQARDRLNDLIKHLEHPDFVVTKPGKVTLIKMLREVEALMYRAPPARVAPRQQRKLTSEQAQEVRDFARKHPNVTMQDIAVRFKTNAGRVSEAVNFLR